MLPVNSHSLFPSHILIYTKVIESEDKILITCLGIERRGEGYKSYQVNKEMYQRITSTVLAEFSWIVHDGMKIEIDFITQEWPSHLKNTILNEVISEFRYSPEHLIMNAPYGTDV